MSVIFVPKLDVRVKESYSLEAVKSTLERVILDIQKDIESNENNFKEGLESVERSQNYENLLKVLNFYKDNIENYEKLFFRKEQLHFIENDPKFLQKIAEIEHKKKTRQKDKLS